MRWIIREWPGPSADGLGPRMALNTARPSTDPPMARFGQAIHGCQAIRGWPGSAYGPEQFLPCRLSVIERCRTDKVSWTRIRSAPCLFFNACRATCMDNSSPPFCLPSNRVSEICAQRNAKTCRRQTASCPVGDICFECKTCWRLHIAASGSENSNSRSQWRQKMPSCNSLSLSAQDTRGHLSNKCFP